MTAETVNTDFLPIIYDIIRSIEKDTYENVQKPHETVDTNLKIPELRNKLQQCREQIQKLPGIDYTKEEQLRRLDALREQLVQKRQLLLKNIIVKHIRLQQSFFKTIQRCYMNDKNYIYFQKNEKYKSSIIELSNDFNEKKLTDVEISFLAKDQGGQIDKIFSHLSARENVMKLPMLQLKDTLYLMANAKMDTVKYENIMTYMDEKCAVSVDRWNLDFCLYVLDAWLIILGPKAFRNHYFCALTNLLNKKMKKCTKYNLILTLYFIGLSKKEPPFLMELAEYKLEKFVTDLTDEELAIACLSFFKTSTKMKSKILLRQCIKAAENLALINDRFNLISILKCLRLSQYCEPHLIYIIEEYIVKEHASFNFVECTNFLAFLATKNLYSFEVYKCIENHGINLLSKENSAVEFTKEIEKMHPSERSRVKDLARFLWGMAFVGHDINQESVNFIIDLLNIKISSSEFETNLPALIDCVQSLVLLGYFPMNIVEYVLNPAFFQRVSNINKAKPKYQLYFISRSAYVENFVNEVKSTKFMYNIPKNLQNDILQREGFQELLDYLNVHLEKNSFICCYIMPHIMISGIVVASYPKENKSDKLITSKILQLMENGIISKNIQNILQEDKIYTCIELLDQSVCLNNSAMPLGLMKTKIRQLQKLNIDVITLMPDEVKTLVKSNTKTQYSKLQNLIY